jgi:hypothetical protein
MEDGGIDLAAACGAQDETVRWVPLDVAERKRLAALKFMRGDHAAAVNDLAVALVLPVEDAAKDCLADDLAIVVPALIAQGGAALLAQNRFRWALASNLGVAELAYRRFFSALTRGNPLHLSPLAVAEVVHFFESFAGADGVLPRLACPFPLQGDKPVIDIVWFEITNHCNQSCTFCPDSHRVGPRTKIPFDRFTRVVDDLAAHAVVHSMQLNAYGEPLLHPEIGKMIAYLKERRVPWSTFFTTHGMTLVPPNLKKLSGNFPNGIAVSLQNDGQESYAATRNTRLGDYPTLVTRVADLLGLIVAERADCHLRIYQMVCNGHQSPSVDAAVQGAFPHDVGRFRAAIRAWEERARAIAAAAPDEARAQATVTSDDRIEQTFVEAGHGDGNILPILAWTTTSGRREMAFISPRPLGDYANLLPEHHPDWRVERRIVGDRPCGFTAKPSLALFASGKMGLCCLDLEGTSTFGDIRDYPTIGAALRSPECLRRFAELANGVACGEGCRICLGEARKKEGR